MPTRSLILWVVATHRLASHGVPWSRTPSSVLSDSEIRVEACR